MPEPIGNVEAKVELVGLIGDDRFEVGDFSFDVPFYSNPGDPDKISTVDFLPHLRAALRGWLASGEKAEGAVIEIIEKRPAPLTGDLGVVPTEVRINGQRLLSPADHPIRIHEIDLDDQSLALVTLTLVARRIRVDTEEATTDV